MSKHSTAAQALIWSFNIECMRVSPIKWQFEPQLHAAHKGNFWVVPFRITKWWCSSPEAHSTLLFCCFLMSTCALAGTLNLTAPLQQWLSCFTLSAFESREMKQWVTQCHKYHPLSHSGKQLRVKNSFGLYEGDEKIQNLDLYEKQIGYTVGKYLQAWDKQTVVPLHDNPCKCK